MQEMALCLDLARKRLLAKIVTERQGLWRGRPFTESTTIGPDGERRWGGWSRDTPLTALEETYHISN